MAGNELPRLDSLEFLASGSVSPNSVQSGGEVSPGISKALWEDAELPWPNNDSKGAEASLSLLIFGPQSETSPTLESSDINLQSKGIPQEEGRREDWQNLNTIPVALPTLCNNDDESNVKSLGSPSSSEILPKDFWKRNPGLSSMSPKLQKDIVKREGWRGPRIPIRLRNELRALRVRLNECRKKHAELEGENAKLRTLLLASHSDRLKDSQDLLSVSAKPKESASQVCQDNDMHPLPSKFPSSNTPTERGPSESGLSQPGVSLNASTSNNFRKATKGIDTGLEACPCSSSCIPEITVEDLRSINKKYIEKKEIYSRDSFSLNLIRSELLSSINSRVWSPTGDFLTGSADINVICLEPTLLCVQSQVGWVLYQKCSNSAKFWSISDGNISMKCDKLSVSKIFEAVYDTFDDEYGVRETLCRLILHTIAVSECAQGDNACYSGFIKSSTKHKAGPGVCSDVDKLLPLFDFDLDLPISLSVLLLLFNIRLDNEKPYLESKSLKAPFSFDKGFMHIGAEGNLSDAGIEIIKDLQDNVLVGTYTATKHLHGSCQGTVVSSENSRREASRKLVRSAALQKSDKRNRGCAYIHALGLKSLSSCAHTFIGYEEIKEQMRKMGVPVSMMTTILFEEFAPRKGQLLTSTCSELSLHVADYIRSCSSTINEPIVLESDRKGPLIRIPKHMPLFFLNQKKKWALSRLSRNVTVSGQVELNSGLLKLGISAAEKLNARQPVLETLRMSKYVEAIANVKLKNDVIELGDECKASLWIDPDYGPAFQAACLIALWTMDPRVELIGDLAGIEDARWRKIEGLEKDEKCIVDVPISQFVYTLDKTKIEELQVVNKSFLAFNECNVNSNENIYVGRMRCKA